MEIIGRAKKENVTFHQNVLFRKRKIRYFLRVYDFLILAYFCQKMQQFCLTLSNINYIMKVDVSLGTVLKFARAIRVIIIPP